MTISLYDRETMGRMDESDWDINSLVYLYMMGIH